MAMAALADESLLWRRFRQGGDRDAQQLLFAQYAPWARAVARDVYRRVRIVQMDWADYSQNATLGLVEAMGRYDPERGVDFIAYAKPRVRGAVFNGLRAFMMESSQAQDGSARYQERLSSFDESEPEDLLGQLVASVSGLAVGFMLDSAAAEELMQPNEAVEDAIDREQTGVLLRAAVERLPEREELVVRLHYFQHMPFVDIAQLLGLTKGRISQIHKAAIERLRSSAHAGTGPPVRY